MTVERRVFVCVFAGASNRKIFGVGKTYRHVDPGGDPGKSKMKTKKEPRMKMEPLRVLGKRGTKWLKAHLRQAGCGPLGDRTLPVSKLKSGSRTLRYAKLVCAKPIRLPLQTLHCHEPRK
jgi:hypothetical protein